ncbi:MAG: SpoIIE family protein phosphatase [Spirochaetota bacterium]
MARIFYFFARKFSYTAAIALSTFMMILAIMVLESAILNFLITSVIDIKVKSMIYGDIIRFIDLVRQPVIFMIIEFLYCLQFGLLSFIKIPAFYKPLRHINKNIHGNTLNPDIKDEDLNRLYNQLTKIPGYNMLINLLLTITAGAITFTISYFEIKQYGEDLQYPAEIFFVFFLDYIKIFIILHLFIIIISALSTYILTDTITSRERAACFNELRRRNNYLQPKSFLKLRVKFNIIIVFMLIALFAFGLLIKQGKLEANIDLIGFIIYFIISIFAVMIIINTTANSILRIFRDISRVSQDIAKGVEAKFNFLPLEREFSTVEYLILQMDREIIEHRKNLEAKVEERTAELRKALSNLKERDDLIQKQLDMAGTIQRGILPGRINDWNELTFSVKYFSMDKIGGDFYDVHQMEGNKIVLYVADVSGHGIPAALVTTMAKVSFGNAFLKYNSPKKIFREVNQELLEHVKSQDYLTCFMVLIDEEYNVTYSNASHQKAIILRNSENRIETLDTGGLFIGAIEDAKETYEEKTTKLNYGDRLILYTDGIPEASNSAKEHYSNERFEKTILENKNMQLREFTNFIIDDLQNFTGGMQVQDDITLLIIELKRDVTIDIIKNVKNLINEKKNFEAIDLLKKGLEQYPENQRLLYNLAKCYFRANDFTKVLNTIHKYTERDKDNKFAYYLAGAAAYKIADFDTAVELFQKALNIDTNFVNALFALGMSYKESGLKEEAARCFEKVKNIDEDYKMADYELIQLKS